MGRRWPSLYETWADAEIRRLEELRLTAVEERIDAELAAGHDAELVAELEELVAESPLRERLWGQLMLALYRAGRQGDASYAYQKARQTLVDELGIEPGPELRRLHGSIVRQEVDAARGARVAAGGAELTEVVAAVLEGRLVPVLGAETDDLESRLAERFHYPRSEPTDIARVSQYAAVTLGYGPLHDELREWAVATAEPKQVHRFLATLPPLLRQVGVPHQLIVTTSYGGALERAFADAGEEIDIVSYLSTGPDRGKFRHLAPDGSSHVIDLPNLYAQELSLDKRTIVLRLRGGLDDAGDARSFVVTEDDHIEYLRRADVTAAVPVALAATLRRSHFLFLGYTVRDLDPPPRPRTNLGRGGNRLPLVGRAPEPRPRRAGAVAPPRRRAGRDAARPVHARARRGARCRRQGHRVTTATSPATLIAPFRGLSPFGDSELDAMFFFGRERDTEIVVANLLAARLTVLYGPSGVGKTSLLRAGVARRMRALAGRGASRRRPGSAVVVFSSWAGDPVPLLAQAVAAEVSAITGVHHPEQPSSSRLADIVDHWSTVLDGELFIVLDQLEEHFVYHEDEAGPGTLVGELPEVVSRPHLRAHVLLAPRRRARTARRAQRPPAEPVRKRGSPRLPRSWRGYRGHPRPGAAVQRARPSGSPHARGAGTGRRGPDAGRQAG